MNLTGVLAPIPTPFDEADRVDLKRLRTALRRWMKTPLTGVVVLGSTGEAALVDDAEADRIVATARETVPKKRTFIVGTGRESTRATMKASARAAKLGADAVLVRTPSFYRSTMTPDVLIAHYRAVADRSPVPVLLYSFPALMGVTLSRETVAELATHPNIAGIKDSSGDVLQLTDYVSAVSGSFRVLSGSASTFHTAISLGAEGGILALSCLLPHTCVRLCTLTISGSQSEARGLQQKVLPVTKLLSRSGVAGLKAALGLIGCDVGFPRRPLAPVPDATLNELKEQLAFFEEKL